MSFSFLCSGKFTTCYYSIRIKPDSPLNSSSETEMLGDQVLSRSPPPPPLYRPRDLPALRSTFVPSEMSKLPMTDKPRPPLNQRLSYPAPSEQVPPRPPKWSSTDFPDPTTTKWTFASTASTTSETLPTLFTLKKWIDTITIFFNSYIIKFENVYYTMHTLCSISYARS